MIAIARALSFHPRVLLLDEPTSSLSEGEIEKLYQTLRVLRAQGVGILYVSHRLEEISQIADCVTVLRDGKLVDTKPIRRNHHRQHHHHDGRPRDRHDVSKGKRTPG